MTPPPEWRADLTNAAANVQLQVTPENVLQVRNVLLTEANQLAGLAYSGQSTSAFVGLCGGDPVSHQAAVAFNQRVQVLVDQCADYANELKKTAYSLDAIARSYGHTEEQIEASFRAFQPSVPS